LTKKTKQTKNSWQFGLRSRPSDTVTIVLSWAFDISNPGGVTSAGITFSPSTLIFTASNWNITQTISIVPVSKFDFFFSSPGSSSSLPNRNFDDN
jgi:hypothetical protein